MRSFSSITLSFALGLALVASSQASWAASTEQHNNIGITPIRQINPSPPPLPTEGRVWSVKPGGGDDGGHGGGGHHGGDLGSGHTSGGSVGGGSSGNQGGIGGVGGLGDTGTGKTGGHSAGPAGAGVKK